MGRVAGREMPDGLTVEDLIRELQQRHPGARVLGEQVRYAMLRSGVERGRREVEIQRPRKEQVQAVAAGDAETIYQEWEARYLPAALRPGSGQALDKGRGERVG